MQAVPVRTNRSTQHWTVQMTQSGSEGKTHVTTTATVVTAVRRETWGVNDLPMPEVPSPERVERLSIGPARVAWLERYEMRPVSGSIPTRWDGGGDHSETRMWLRDAEPRPLDFASLAALSDTFYPRVWLRRATHVPIGTVSITTYFHTDAATAGRDRHGLPAGPRDGAAVPQRLLRPGRAALERIGRTTGDQQPDRLLQGMTMNKAALIVGAGDATGGAIARRFARGGYAACVTRRSLDKLQPLVAQIEAEGGKAHAFASDARKEEEVVALVEQIESTIGPIEVLVFNIGANVPESILTETARKYFKVWEMACFSGFLNGREVAKRMVARELPEGAHRGTIIFTGATASMRGAANFGAFSGAKMALRALAQSMARELGPRGIHVAHVDHRRRHRHRIHPQQLPRALCAEGAGRHPQPRPHRRRLLDAALAAARRLDARARPAAVDREILRRQQLMTTRSVDFYFDFGSPASYLAATQLPQLCADAGAELVWKPMLLGGVFQATGNHSPADDPRQGPVCVRPTWRASRSATACRCSTTRTSRSTRCC